MFNRIAVVLRGHVRTWHYINKYVFSEFSSISKSVDYYFVTWYSAELDIDKIKTSFRGQTLKKFVSVVYDQHQNPSQTPSYLSSHILDDIINGNYDAVIDTRPDVLPGWYPEFSPIISGNTVLNRWTRKRFELHNRFQTDDLLQMMKPETFKIFCNAYKTSNFFPREPHADLWDHYTMNQVNMSDAEFTFKKGFLGIYIARPNNLELILNNKDGAKWLVPEGREEIWKITKEWWKLTKEEKRNLILKYPNILPSDYQV